MKRILWAVLSTSLFTAGCADPVAPSTPIPAVPTVTDTFSDTLLVLGANTHQFTVTAKTGGLADNGVQVLILGGTNSGTLAATASGANAVTKVDAAGELVDNAGASLASPILLTAKPLSDGTVLQNATLGIQFDVDNTAARNPPIPTARPTWPMWAATAIGTPATTASAGR